MENPLQGLTCVDIRTPTYASVPKINLSLHLNNGYVVTYLVLLSCSYRTKIQLE